MPDPFSIISGVIGAAAAGVQLSVALFDVVDTVVSAPEETAELAKEMQFLASIFEDLRDVLETGQGIYNQKFLHNAKSILDSFIKLKVKVEALIKFKGKRGRFKFLFKSKKVARMLDRVEALKSALSIHLMTMRVAIDQRKEQPLLLLPSSDSSAALPPRRPNRFRKLAEAVIRQNRETALRLQDKRNKERLDASHNAAQVQSWHVSETLVADKMAIWLFRLVFTSTPSADDRSGFEDSLGPTDHASPGRDDTARRASDDSTTKESPVEEQSAQLSEPSNLDTPRSSQDPRENGVNPSDIASSLSRSWKINASAVLDGLLHAWTNLSLDEIENSGGELETHATDFDPTTSDSDTDDFRLLEPPSDGESTHRPTPLLPPPRESPPPESPLRESPPPITDEERILLDNLTRNEETERRRWEQDYEEPRRKETNRDSDFDLGRRMSLNDHTSSDRRASIPEPAEIYFGSSFAYGNSRGDTIRTVKDTFGRRTILTTRDDSPFETRKGKESSVPARSFVISKDTIEPRVSLPRILLPVEERYASPKTVKMAETLERLGMSSFFNLSIGKYGKFSNQISGDVKEVALERDEFVSGSVLWDSSGMTVCSELMTSLLETGVQIIYVRGSDSGQTWFVGNTPAHVYFFRPDYTPQIPSLVAPSEEESSKYLAIGKEWLEEDVLNFRDVPFADDDPAFYFLDPDLEFSDIAKFVEASFELREACLRRIVRKSVVGPRQPLHSGNIPGRNRLHVSQPLRAQNITSSEARAGSPAQD